MRRNVDQHRDEEAAARNGDRYGGAAAPLRKTEGGHEGQDCENPEHPHFSPNTARPSQGKLP